MFDQALDVTSLSLSNDAAYEYKQSAFTPVLDFRKLSTNRTTEFGGGSARPGRTHERSALEDITPVADLSSDHATDGSGSDDEFKFDPQVEATSKARMHLLARSYVGDSADKEMISRIEILTLRLRKMSPRTSTAQLEAQELVVKEIEEVDHRLQAIKARLNSL